MCLSRVVLFSFAGGSFWLLYKTDASCRAVRCSSVIVGVAADLPLCFCRIRSRGRCCNGRPRAPTGGAARRSARERSCFFDFAYLMKNVFRGVRASSITYPKKKNCYRCAAQMVAWPKLAIDGAGAVSAGAGPFPSPVEREFVSGYATPVREIGLPVETGSPPLVVFSRELCVIAHAVWFVQ